LLSRQNELRHEDDCLDSPDGDKVSATICHGSGGAQDFTYTQVRVHSFVHTHCGPTRVTGSSCHTKRRCLCAYLKNRRCMAFYAMAQRALSAYTALLATA